MIQIVPVVNVKTFKKFQERLKILKDFPEIFQVDVSDGRFTDFKNWADPLRLKDIKWLRDRFEAHLMVKYPEEEVYRWQEIKPKRLIFHIESIKNFDLLEKVCLENKIEIGLALNPYTDLKFIDEFLKSGRVKYVLLLGVNPGPSGQEFHWFVLDKIQILRQKYPKIDIELDGGVDEKIALEGAKAGANILALGSYLFEDKIKNSEELLKKINQLKAILKANDF